MIKIIKLKDVNIGDKIRIVDVSKIEDGDGLWEDGEIVEVVAVDLNKKLLEVTCREFSEYIHAREFNAIEII